MLICGDYAFKLRYVIGTQCEAKMYKTPIVKEYLDGSSVLSYNIQITCIHTFLCNIGIHEGSSYYNQVSYMHIFVSLIGKYIYITSSNDQKTSSIYIIQYTMYGTFHVLLTQFSIFRVLVPISLCCS